MPGDTAWLASPWLPSYRETALTAFMGIAESSDRKPRDEFPLKKVGHQFNRRVCLSFFRINLRLLLAISPGRHGIKVERRGPLKSFLRRLDD
jgi:hypothetical protein